MRTEIFEVGNTPHIIAMREHHPEADLRARCIEIKANPQAQGR